MILVTTMSLYSLSVLLYVAQNSDVSTLPTAPPLTVDQLRLRSTSSVWRHAASTKQASLTAAPAAVSADSSHVVAQPTTAPQSQDVATSSAVRLPGTVMLKLEQFPPRCEEDGRPCYGVLAGIDTAPGRQFDLTVLKGSTLEACVEACDYRNKLILNEDSSEPKCLAIVFVGRNCFLKRSAEITSTRIRANSLILGLKEIPLRATTREETSVLFAVLTEHHYVTERLVPSFNSWLADEDVMLLLETATQEERSATEQLLAPYMRGGMTRRSALRLIHYLDKHDVISRAAEAANLLKRKEGNLLNGVGWDERRRNKLLEDTLRRALGAAQGAAGDATVRRELSKLLAHRQYRLPEQSGAWKNLPGTYHMFRRLPNYSYYIIVDDDSFFIQRNFYILLGSFYVPRMDPLTQMLYTGQLSLWFEPTHVGAQRSWTQTLFQQGGSGILMSHATVKHVYGIVNSDCRIQCDYLPHGDVRLGCCMTIAKVNPVQESTLWHMNVYRAQGMDARQLNSIFPVSFHRMKNESMMGELQQCVDEAFERIDKRGGGLVLSEPMMWKDILSFYAPRRNNLTEYKYFMKGLA